MSTGRFFISSAVGGLVSAVLCGVMNGGEPPAQPLRSPRDPFLDEERYQKVVSMVGRNADGDFPDPANFENEKDRKARLQWSRRRKALCRT